MLETAINPLRLILLEVITTVGLFVMAILIHEFGHYWNIRRRWRQAKIYFYKGALVVGEEWMYKGLTRQEKVLLLYEGVLAGLLILLPLMFLVNVYLTLAAIFLYLAGSGHDLRRLFYHLKEAHLQWRIPGSSSET